MQRNLTGGFVNNQIDPSRLSPIAPELRAVPAGRQADPCGRVQYGIPNNNTEHQALAKVDYTLNNQQTVFARYLYAVYDNPATYDGKNVLTLSRTGQNNQAHSVVVGHNWRAVASLVNSLRVTYNKTINDRPLPEYFTATDLGSKVYSPLPGLHRASTSPATASRSAPAAPIPATSTRTASRSPTTSTCCAGNHQISFGGNWIHTKIETLNNRPTNGAFTFNGQSTGLSLADFMLGVAQRRLPAGQPGLRLRRSRLHRRLRAGRLARARRT